jgi:hypothetical protein
MELGENVSTEPTARAVGAFVLGTIHALCLLVELPDLTWADTPFPTESRFRFATNAPAEARPCVRRLDHACLAERPLEVRGRSAYLHNRYSHIQIEDILQLIIPGR